MALEIFWRCIKSWIEVVARFSLTEFDRVKKNL
jgi:hypothetical protein